MPSDFISTQYSQPSQLSAPFWASYLRISKYNVRISQAACNFPVRAYLFFLPNLLYSKFQIFLIVNSAFSTKNTSHPKKNLFYQSDKHQDLEFCQEIFFLFQLCCQSFQCNCFCIWKGRNAIGSTQVKCYRIQGQVLLIFRDLLDSSQHPKSKQYYYSSHFSINMSQVQDFYLFLSAKMVQQFPFNFDCIQTQILSYHPYQNQILNYKSLEVETWVRQGQKGMYSLVKSYLSPQPKAVVRVVLRWLISQNLSHLDIRRGVHNDPTFGEPIFLGERVEHLGLGRIGGTMAYLIAVGYGDRHSSIFMFRLLSYKFNISKCILLNIAYNIISLFILILMQENQKRANTLRNETIQIKIKTLNGTLVSVVTSPYATVASIQGQIQQKTGVPISMQRLLHKAVLLQPVKYLSDYGICDGNTIKLVANMLPQEISSPSISTHRQSEVAQTNALTQQNLKTKKHRYLQQRINGFSFKTQQSIQAIKQAKTTVDRLLGSINNSKQNTTQPFLLENRQLFVGDWVDVRDVSGLWVEGQVVSKKHNFVEIHCNGYPDRWNQWIEQSSERIMPLRTQTVQLQDSPYFSPFPVNRAQIKSVKQPQLALQKIISELPSTLKQFTRLMQQLNMDERKSTQLLQHPKFKYSFNEEQQQQDLAESFKNNRSHQSPPHSIHQEEYEQYEYDQQIKLPLMTGVEVKQGESSSIKGMTKMKIKTRGQLMRSNRYIQAKKPYLGYSKTKSEHEHTLNHRQQTPKKDNIAMIDEVSGDRSNIINNVNSTNVVIVRKQDEISEKGGIVQPQHQNRKQQALQNRLKQSQMDIQEVSSPKGQTHLEYSIQTNAHLSEVNVQGSASKQSYLQADNISNRCENISNKGQHDDGESSAKSFGSKRSDRFPDASSMKSLNINIHNDGDAKHQRPIHNKKNIFVFDHSEAQSVKEVQNKDGVGKSNYYYNQQGILEEEDSQINEQTNEQYFIQKKKEYIKKLRATQLAPLCDRLGRMLVDLSPHLATLGYRQYNASQLINQNLSTFTNEGSLQSRMKQFGLGDDEQEERESYKSSKYWSFQIPVMLTPWEIIKLNKLLSEERDNNQ